MSLFSFQIKKQSIYRRGETILAEEIEKQKKKQRFELINLRILLHDCSNTLHIIFTYKGGRKLKMTTDSQNGEQTNSCRCLGHNEFEKVMREIKKNGNYEECLQTADDLYGIKQYNILGLTPKKVIQLYNSVCNRVYLKSDENHQQCWVSYELKIFTWMIVCHLDKKISNPENLNDSIWESYRKIFHNKNLQLVQYQAKLVSCGRCQPRKWQKQEQELLAAIIKPNEINSKWNQIAKKLYFNSGRKYFRNPKQVRQHWLNHLNPQISKESWTGQEDLLIVDSVLKNGRKWALAAKVGGGKRTQHMIKNRFYALLRNEEKCNPSIHDKEKILRILQKKLETSYRKITASENIDSKSIKREDQAQNHVGLVKEQNKFDSQSKLQYNEQMKPNLQEKQKDHKFSQDLMQVEFKNWTCENNEDLKDQEIELYELGNYEKIDHPEAYENYQLFFSE